MKGSNIGEFEELVLLIIAILDDEAYGVSIKEELEKQSGRKISIGAVHASTNRLVEKGFLDAAFGEVTLQRGGKRKKYYKVTSFGQKALGESRDMRNRLWDMIPQSFFNVNLNKS